MLATVQVLTDSVVGATLERCLRHSRSSVPVLELAGCKPHACERRFWSRTHARSVVALSEAHWPSGEPSEMGDEAPTLGERQGPFLRGS